MSTAFAAATATTPAKSTTAKVSSSATVTSNSEKTVTEIGISSVGTTTATSAAVTIVADRAADLVITETKPTVAATIREPLVITTDSVPETHAQQHSLTGFVQKAAQIEVSQAKLNIPAPLILNPTQINPLPCSSQSSKKSNKTNQEEGNLNRKVVEGATNERNKQTGLKHTKFLESIPVEINNNTATTTTTAGSSRQRSHIEKKDKCSAVNNSVSSYPRPIGGYKYSMEFLYTIGRNMTGVTLNIPTPTSITPRALRSQPPSNSPHMIPSLMATIPSGNTANTSSRYAAGNSYIFQAYVPTSSQRRLWHSENAMWQYDRNYPYNQPYATTFGVTGMVSLGYDSGQYGSQRFMYPNYYQPSNYHNSSRSSPPGQNQQSTSGQQQHQSQSSPTQHQHTQTVKRNSGVSSTACETSDMQQRAEPQSQILGYQTRSPDSQNQQEAPPRGSMPQTSASTWRYNSRQNNRERFGSGRTQNNSTVVSNCGTFCESKSYYNSGGRYKSFDPTRNQRSNNTSESIINTSSSTNSNNTNKNNSGIKNENDNNNNNNNNKGSQRNSNNNNKGAGNTYYAKRNKKAKDSTKNKESNSSRSHSSSSHDSSTRLRSSENNAKSSTSKTDDIKNALVNTNISGTNYRPYHNRSYRNRIRYNSEHDQQTQQTNVSNSRTTFHSRQPKRSEQRSGGFSRTSTTSVETKSQHSRYYHSRQNECGFQANRNFINYPCTYPAEPPTGEFINSMHVTTSSKMTSCNIEMYVLRSEINDIEGSITSITSNDESDGPNSYASCDVASTCPSSESSMSRESVASMVQTIAYNCFARATGIAVPHLAGPNWIPFGDIARFFEAEDKLRQQNGFKHPENMEIPSSEVARIGKYASPLPICSSPEQNDISKLISLHSAVAVPPDNNNVEINSSDTEQDPDLPCLHDRHGYTPADRFLARSHLIEMKHPPHNLLINSKWDNLAQCVWNKFMNAQQNEKIYRLKMRLWRFIYLVIMAKFPRYGLYLVGSSISNFGANGSDIDMCLLASTNIGVDPRMEAVYHLQIIRECLFQTTEFEDFNLIEARVPILRFTDSQNKVEVDINFNNSVGIRNTHLLYCYSQLEWRLRPIVLVIKQWAQYHNINNAKNMTISSYSLVLMVIHFLQAGVSPPVLPCLHKISPEKFTLLGPTDYGYVDMNEVIEPYESNNKQSIGELILEFLRYYTFFEYGQYAISVRVGGLLPIDVCRTAKAAKNDVHQWNELCIEEPFDQTNTARSVYDSGTFERIKSIIGASWRLLDQTHQLHSIFEGYVGPMVLLPTECEIELQEGGFRQIPNESAVSENKTQSTPKQPRPLMIDKSVVALIRGADMENRAQQTNVEMTDSLAEAGNPATVKEQNAEVATNKTPVESVAEPLEHIGIKPGT